MRRRGSFRLAETYNRSIGASAEVGTDFRHRARISERNKGIAPAMGSEKDSLRQMVTTAQSRPARFRFFNAVQERQHTINYKTNALSAWLPCENKFTRCIRIRFI